MNLRRVSAMARKEFIHVWRDPRSLGMAIGMPMLLLVMFGYALTLDVDNVPVVVWDQSQTPASRDFLSRVEGSPYFSIRGRVDGYAAMEHAIDSGKALMAIVMPTDFGRRVGAGRPAAVQVIVDGSDANTASISLGYMRVVALLYSEDVMLREVRRRGLTLSGMPLDARPRVWFNTDMESRNYIIPGLISVIMMVIAALLTSLTVAREWESGTMEQLISTPVRGNELILGKLLPYFVIGMLDVLLAVLMGQFLFHVPLRGNVGLLFGIAAIFLTGTLAFGILISVVTKSQLLASQLAVITSFLPAFLLSGFMFAVSNMPKAVQIVTYLFPARYFVALLKGIYLKGIGLEILWGEALLLTVYGALMVALATARFKKRLSA